MNEEKMYVYFHCLPDGTPFYVGKGTKKRARYLYRIGNQRHQEIVAKYGKAVVIDLQECSDEAGAYEDEQYFIMALRERGVDLVNISSGGAGNGDLPPEVRAKMASRGMLGKTQSDLQRRRVSETHTGKNVSEETRKKLREARLGKVSPFKGVTGRYTPEQLRRISEGNKGRTWSEEAKARASLQRKGKKPGPRKSKGTATI